MIRRLLSACLLAGFVAGLVVSLAQAWQTVPLIVAAEGFETAGEAVADDHATTAGHDHAPAAWAPADGAERWLWTILANILTGIGFAFLLAGAMSLSGRRLSARRGAMWGIAGFAVFTLAPALGLPPVLPGADVAPLAARQAWWIGTALATAGGLWLLLLLGRPAARFAGIALLALPHLVGAPAPGAAGGTASPELAAQFAIASLAVAVVFWTTLGATLGRLLATSRST